MEKAEQNRRQHLATTVKKAKKFWPKLLQGKSATGETSSAGNDESVPEDNGNYKVVTK